MFSEKHLDVFPAFPERVYSLVFNNLNNNKNNDV
jgi:hypothetical protein